MKPLFILLSSVIIILCSSCGKEYVCVCTNVNTGNVTQGDKIKTNAFTKKANEETCKNNSNLSAGTLKDCHLE